MSVSLPKGMWLGDDHSPETHGSAYVGTGQMHTLSSFVSGYKIINVKGVKLGLSQGDKGRACATSMASLGTT